MQADFIYKDHVDLFTEVDNGQTLEEISAIVIGREIKKICAGNQNLLNRLKQILQSHIDQKVESLFIRNMVAENQGNVEKSVQLIQNIQSSLE